jgi:hypothetical protein
MQEEQISVLALDSFTKQKKESPLTLTEIAYWINLLLSLLTIR